MKRKQVLVIAALIFAISLRNSHAMCGSGAVYNLADFPMNQINTIKVGDIVAAEWNGTTTPYRGKVIGVSPNNDRYFEQYKKKNQTEIVGASLKVLFKAIRSTPQGEPTSLIIKRFSDKETEMKFEIKESNGVQ